MTITFNGNSVVINEQALFFNGNGSGISTANLLSSGFVYSPLGIVSNGGVNYSVQSGKVVSTPYTPQSVAFTESDQRKRGQS